MHIEQNVDLQPYTTLKIPVYAAYFASVTSTKDVLECLAYAHEHQLPVCILGGGSNVVFTKDWEGLVLHINLVGTTILSEDDESIVVRVGAGENWHDFVTTSIANGWYGLENLALIPGTVGAAPVQNIGAYGVEVAEYIDSVEAVDIAQKKVQQMHNADCKFAYRSSIFRDSEKGKWLITAVTFQLSKNPAPNLSYPALQRKLQEQHIDEDSARPADVMHAVIAVRQSKLPDPADVPNAGSFFKNPIVSKQKYEELVALYPDMPGYPHGADMKVPASWLIEHLGYKGVLKNGVGMYEKHALVLVNKEHSGGETVMQFVAEVQQAVTDRFGIVLEIEPIVL